MGWEYLWILLIVSAVLCAVGFHKYVYFLSIGYGFAVAGIGAALMILFGGQDAVLPWDRRCDLRHRGRGGRRRAEERAERQHARKGRPAAPGVWLLYRTGLASSDVFAKEVSDDARAHA